MVVQFHDTHSPFIFFSVSMEFFDDILIPYEYLQQPSKLYLFGDVSKLQSPQQHKTKWEYAQEIWHNVRN